MFEDVILEKIQEDLLSKLVEIERSLPLEKRGKFLVAQSMSVNEATFLYTGGPKTTGHMRDIEILAQYGFLNLSDRSGRTPKFYVTPIGFKFYEFLKTSSEPVENVEKEIAKHISTKTFVEEYSSAFEKWSKAEKILWGDDSQQNLTTIGHLCREAMQEYAETLARKHGVPETDDSKANTVNKLRAVIKKYKPGVGNTVSEFLDALIPYWGTVSDLAQRQEHGSEREDRQLSWEDARRLVFQTAVLFMELDKGVKMVSKK